MLRGTKTTQIVLSHHILLNVFCHEDSVALINENERRHTRETFFAEHCYTLRYSWLHKEDKHSRNEPLLGRNRCVDFRG